MGCLRRWLCWSSKDRKAQDRAVARDTIETAAVRAQAESIVGEIRQNLDRLDRVLIDIGAKENQGE